ncbi:Transcriptional regulator [Lysobacter dokdonensis DS-58]|uniref:Transcriptional regulator n=1 Tax=Lysobacter dokdonensis DS-58 TaxID=1300345 RepID=A0A0A2X5R7_9GAMM|nr:LysR family transcriptional regulator [Lysobacter dokdonensis]KGQ20579.1 Transcriptional regulator [Lysobacter dokdonensis DS-58]
MLNQIDLSRVDLNLLVVFETVLSTQHVGRAAERLFVSPSAVSHGLGRLRRLLGDPLFLKTPRGVVPTVRALELAVPIADVLTGVRRVVSAASPFDAATSTRRFAIGAPDAVSVVLLQPLLASLRETAPGIDLTIRQLLPVPKESAPERAWRGVFADLDAHALDIAIAPVAQAPARFEARVLYEEDFVIAARARHPFVRTPTLDRFCEMQHLVVSSGGDPHGFVDDLLAEQGRARRVALTVPNFLFALTLVAGSDLVSAVPRRLVETQGRAMGVVAIEPPLPLGRFPINAIAPRAALADAGVAWLLDRLSEVG